MRWMKDTTRIYLGMILGYAAFTAYTRGHHRTPGILARAAALLLPGDSDSAE